MRVCVSCGSTITGAGWQCSTCRFVPGELDGYAAFAPAFAVAHRGFNPAHFSVLARHEETHFWFVARRHLLCELLRRYFADARDFLEIGCGTGSILAALAERFPALQLSGSEIHTEGLAFAAKRLARSIALYQMDACRIPFHNEFDVVGAFDVLEHIEDDRAALSAVHNALKPGGGVLLTVPQHPWLGSEVDGAAHHRRRYRLGELELADVGRPE